MLERAEHCLGGGMLHRQGEEHTGGIIWQCVSKGVGRVSSKL